MCDKISWREGRKWRRKEMLEESEGISWRELKVLDDKLEGAESSRSTFTLSLLSFIFFIVFYYFGWKQRELRRAETAA